MPYRLAQRANDQIRDIILRSAREWGIDAASRYNDLIAAAINTLSTDASPPGSRSVPGLASLQVYHLRSARTAVASERRVGRPRHQIVYRRAPDGVIDILAVIHDRQHLERAARQAQNQA